MALPAELRLQILRYSVGIAEPIDQRMFHDFQSTIAATTMVCKQLRTESEELFYGNNIFISRFIPTQRSLQQFFREPRKYSDLEHRYLRQDTPYPFPHRIRPTIRHLELVLGVPRPRELTTAVKIWMSPITALESDGYTRLESLKISFRLTADFMEPTLKPAERAAMQQAARKFVAGQKISAKTVYIDWTGLQ